MTKKKISITLSPELAEAIKSSAEGACRNLSQEIEFRLRPLYFSEEVKKSTEVKR